MLMNERCSAFFPYPQQYKPCQVFAKFARKCKPSECTPSSFVTRIEILILKRDYLAM